jgi:hypothetical protein
MIYCVVPKPLEYELYDRLVDYYHDDDNVTVIVDRRNADRRSRGSRAFANTVQRRVVRDRRRARTTGDLLPLATAYASTASA